VAQREQLRTQSYTYTIVIEPDSEAGGYVVTCPALPGLVTQGESLAEARAMAADAIKGYLEILREDGLAIPPGETHQTTPIREEVTVEVAAK
jgi:antitoxin HicB